MLQTSSSRPSQHLRPPVVPRFSGFSSDFAMKIFVAALALCAILSLVVVPMTGKLTGESSTTSTFVGSGDTRLLVFLSSDEKLTNHVVRKNLEDLKNEETISNGVVKVVAATRSEQHRMMNSNCPQAVNSFTSLVEQHQEHLATELWKYCILAHNDGPARLYIDSSSPLLIRTMELLSIASTKTNLAVLNKYIFDKTIHGSLMLVQPNKETVAKKMLSVMVETSAEKLALDPLFLPRKLYESIVTDSSPGTTLTFGRNGNWYLFEQFCNLNPIVRSTLDESWEGSIAYRLNHSCPHANGFCCAVRNGLDTTILLTRRPILPYQTISQDIPRPYNAEAGHYSEEELPYIATIQEKVFSKPDSYPRTPNFFDTLIENDCLPDAASCSKCLREKNGANCKSCAKVCPCYCKVLCREETSKKFVAKELTVVPPLYARDPERLVPRIVHQTYFEELTKEKYPNMSRLVESLKRSGWDYRFYSDEDAQNFLSTHFPAEVREAYDALRPGAFKADLFRYCALLIHGGAYFDVDIMLESSLDHSIPHDVGFIVPVDEPGAEAKRPYCVWNGLIGSAPGHPILAKSIETVVNQVRNRFTSVDVDATFCPDPELSVLHAFDTLHTAGPCLLGATINRVMGRPLQEPFVAGEIDPKNRDADVPGRTIILHQDKWDMGSHRFTFLEQNQVVAATDLEDSNDRENQQTPGKKTEHYSKTHRAVGIYGLEGLYKDKTRADEEITIRVRDEIIQRHKAV